MSLQERPSQNNIHPNRTNALCNIASCVNVTLITRTHNYCFRAFIGLINADALSDLVQEGERTTLDMSTHVSMMHAWDLEHSILVIMPQRGAVPHKTFNL